MDFDKWSFEKRKTFLKSLRHKTNDELYRAFKKEGFETFKPSEGNDFFAMTPSGVQYYFAVKPLKAQKTPLQLEMKKKFMHRYVLIVRD